MGNVHKYEGDAGGSVRDDVWGGEKAGEAWSRNSYYFFCDKCGSWDVSRKDHQDSMVTWMVDLSMLGFPLLLVGIVTLFYHLTLGVILIFLSIGMINYEGRVNIERISYVCNKCGHSDYAGIGEKQKNSTYNYKLSDVPKWKKPDYIW